MKKKLEDLGMGLVEKFLIVEVNESIEIVGEARSFIEAKEKAEKIRGKRRKYVIPVYCLEGRESTTPP